MSEGGGGGGGATLRILISLGLLCLLLLLYVIRFVAGRGGFALHVIKRGGRESESSKRGRGIMHGLRFETANVSTWRQTSGHSILSHWLYLVVFTCVWRRRQVS